MDRQGQGQAQPAPAYFEARFVLMDDELPEAEAAEPPAAPVREPSPRLGAESIAVDPANAKHAADEPIADEPLSDEPPPVEPLPVEPLPVEAFPAEPLTTERLASSPAKPDIPLLPSTEATVSVPIETPDPKPVAASHHKKKGTAVATKKPPKRPQNDGPQKKKKRKKKPKSSSSGGANDESSGDDGGSDGGPYCLCRGPDDHRWMICCEFCEDWFHGECIKMSKEVGEHLIERFVCPSCSSDNRTTIYKKSCALTTCKKSARLSQGQPSVFCSNEHAQSWWERLIGQVPKGQATAGLSDRLSQGELVALLRSDLGTVGEDGMWRLAKVPFANGGPEKDTDDALSPILSDEEKVLLKESYDGRLQLGEETQLCHKMLTLVELAQARRRAAITAGLFGEDICGYDSRLDTVSARDAFAAYAKSEEGDATFRASALTDPLGEDHAVRGMCEKKRCKVHSGWQKMLPLGIKHQVRELAKQAAEAGEEEKVMREAAAERWRRKQAEKNWVEVVDMRIAG
ncbi:Set1 complex component spp1 [Drechmeria coniospora]|uniref:Set1 complex component spp1 n=1 Tax=Drechmeria coniospora TaxID=98403 RepID=A0A151GLP1_DRECN|nr:Set1 complex component spp1 [Drechmeria coniospora]KYK58023.1 Set1 complex component spp1 [Drechmeria coniospora]ODA83139.1 hypothetical protein RJ55_01649 [Drechmeria coniospora]